MTTYSRRRGRLIDCLITESPRLAKCSRGARLTFVLLVATADDQGRERGSPVAVKARCYPLDDKISVHRVATELEELAGADLIIRYGQEEPLLQVKAWWLWQEGMRWSYPSRYPAPDHWTQDRVRTPNPKDAGNIPASRGQDAGDIPPNRNEANRREANSATPRPAALTPTERRLRDTTTTEGAYRAAMLARQAERHDEASEEVPRLTTVES